MPTLSAYSRREASTMTGRLGLRTSVSIADFSIGAGRRARRRTCPLRQPLAGRRVRDRAAVRSGTGIALRSWADSHQIDEREQRNPDDVERVPEQGETKQPPLDGRAKALDRDLK